MDKDKTVSQMFCGQIKEKTKIVFTKLSSKLSKLLYTSVQENGARRTKLGHIVTWSSCVPTNSSYVVSGHDYICEEMIANLETSKSSQY